MSECAHGPGASTLSGGSEHTVLALQCEWILQQACLIMG